jgi:hypothetical protein
MANDDAFSIAEEGITPIDPETTDDAALEEKKLEKEKAKYLFGLNSLIFASDSDYITIKYNNKNKEKKLFYQECDHSRFHYTLNRLPSSTEDKREESLLVKINKSPIFTQETLEYKELYSIISRNGKDYTMSYITKAEFDKQIKQVTSSKSRWDMIKDIYTNNKTYLQSLTPQITSRDIDNIDETDFINQSTIIEEYYNYFKNKDYDSLTRTADIISEKDYRELKKLIDPQSIIEPFNQSKILYNNLKEMTLESDGYYKAPDSQNLDDLYQELSKAIEEKNSTENTHGCLKPISDKLPHFGKSKIDLKKLDKLKEDNKSIFTSDQEIENKFNNLHKKLLHQEQLNRLPQLKHFSNNDSFATEKDDNIIKQPKQKIHENPFNAKKTLESPIDKTLLIINKEIPKESKCSSYFSSFSNPISCCISQSKSYGEKSKNPITIKNAFERIDGCKQQDTLQKIIDNEQVHPLFKAYTAISSIPNEFSGCCPFFQSQNNDDNKIKKTLTTIFKDKYDITVKSESDLQKKLDQISRCQELIKKKIEYLEKQPDGTQVIQEKYVPANKNLNLLKTELIKQSTSLEKGSAYKTLSASRKKSSYKVGPGLFTFCKDSSTNTSQLIINHEELENTDNNIFYLCLGEKDGYTNYIRIGVSKGGEEIIYKQGSKQEPREFQNGQIIMDESTIVRVKRGQKHDNFETIDSKKADPEIQKEFKKLNMSIMTAENGKLREAAIISDAKQIILQDNTQDTSRTTPSTRASVQSVTLLSPPTPQIIAAT